MTFAVSGAGAPQNWTLTPAVEFGSNGDGSIRPGDRVYVTGGSFGANFQRGLAFNPATTNLIFIDRAAGGSGDSNLTGYVYVLDGIQGYDLGAFITDGMSGGDFADYATGVSADGVIYVGNLVNSSSRNFKLYTWSWDGSFDPPAVVFDGVPGNPGGTSQRWGDTMDVRGAGTQTQVLLGSKTFQTTLGTNVAILTTGDGLQFTAAVLTTDAAPGSFGGGVAFGAGETFWAVNSGSDLLHMAYDLNAGRAVTLHRWDAAQFPDAGRLASIAVDAERNLLAALEVGSDADRVRLYDITDLSAPPVLLDIETYPVNNANGSNVGFLDFGAGRLYVHNMNNGLMAFYVAPGEMGPPEVIVQPSPQRLLTGGTARFQVSALRGAAYQWRKDGEEIGGATNYVWEVANATPAHSGDYQVVVRNASGATASSVARLDVFDPAEKPSLSMLWAVAPGSRPYVTLGAASTPFERSIAYCAPSNHLYLISRSSATGGLTVTVLHAGTGAELFKLSTAGISGGSIVLLSIAVAEDGAIYAGNMHTSSTSELATFRLYRWESGRAGVAPVLIFAGQPAAELSPYRWGDTLAVRGQGLDTAILIDANDGRLAALLQPSQSLEAFASTGFTTSYGPGSIGRSLQFGESETFWEKRKALPLVQTRFDLDLASANFGTSTQVVSVNNFPASLGPVGLNLSQKLLAGIDFVSASDVPDTLDLYDIASLEAPLFLGKYPFPINHRTNSNFIGQVLFAEDRVFAVNGNNGLMALEVRSGTPLTPPEFAVHPASQRVLVGETFTLNAFASGANSYQWQHAGTNVPGAASHTLVLTNAQLADAGEYRLRAVNNAGAALSDVARIVVARPEDYPRLAPLWNIVPGSRTYVTVGAANTPFERSLAYDVERDRLYIVSRTSATAGLSIHALNGSSGADVHELDTTGISGGSIALLGIAVAEDGAVYAGNMHNSGSAGAAVFHLYRWATGEPNVPPQLVFSGEPADQSVVLRWGDTLAVRGSGVNTEVLADNNQGNWAALLRPVDDSMAAFVNSGFAQTYGSGPIGRSLAFGEGATFWQKRKNGFLQLSRYDIDPLSPSFGSSALVTNYSKIPTALGPVALDFQHGLLAGINFVSVITEPDTLDLYEISDLESPLFLARYPFPIAHQANANFIGQVVFGGEKVFAINGNNGVVAFTMEMPSSGPAPELQIRVSSNTIVLTWPVAAGTGYVLERTGALTPPISWETVPEQTVEGGGQKSVSQDLSGSARYYRLRK